MIKIADNICTKIKLLWKKEISRDGFLSETNPFTWAKTNQQVGV